MISQELSTNTFLQGQPLFENISSASDLLQRIESFVKKLHIGQTGLLTCTSPSNNSLIFSIKLRSLGEVWRPTLLDPFTYSNVVESEETEKQNDLEENYFFADQVDCQDNEITKVSGHLHKDLRKKGLVVAVNLGATYKTDGMLPKTFNFRENVLPEIISIVRENYPLQNRLTLEKTKVLTPGVALLGLAVVGKIYMEYF